MSNGNPECHQTSTKSKINHYEKVYDRFSFIK